MEDYIREYLRSTCNLIDGTLLLETMIMMVFRFSFNNSGTGFKCFQEM